MLFFYAQSFGTFTAMNLMVHHRSMVKAACLTGCRFSIRMIFDRGLYYTYEKLGEILKDSTQKAKTGKLDLEGKLYGIAAGYAQDFVDTSRAIKHPLDLTGRTEDNVFLTLMRVCAENQAEKRTEAENKENMAKKFGYYQLFALVNSLNCEGKTVEIALRRNLLMAEPKLVILSVPAQNEKRYEFDVLAAVKDTVDGLTILDPKKNSGAILFGQLAPFYTRLKNELMDHIV
jgi:hypothetical protein